MGDLFAFQTPRGSGPWQKLGFIAANGALVIPQEYAFSHHSKFGAAGYCMVTRPGESNIRIINRDNETLLVLPQDHTSVFWDSPDAHGIFPVTHRLDHFAQGSYEIQGRDRVYTGRSRHLAMNLAGEEVFEADISKGVNGLYRLKQPETNDRPARYGIINHQGRVKVPPVFDHLRWSRSDPLVSVLRDGHMGVIDYDGNEVIPITIPAAGLSDLAEVKDGILVYADHRKGACFSIDMAGNTLAKLPFTYWSPGIPKAAPTLSDGLMLITEPDRAKAYYLDAYGEAPMRGPSGRVKTFGPDVRLGYFYEGLATYRIDGLSGFINTSGTVQIAEQFESAGHFSHGLARVFATKEDRFNDRIAYIDPQGTRVARNF